MKRSIDNRYSRYVKSGITTQHKTRTGWWERKKFTLSDSDDEYRIEAEYHQRPSKLALDRYGKSEYMFFILQYNNILDIQAEFIEGNVIRLPTPERVHQDLLSGRGRVEFK